MVCNSIVFLGSQSSPVVKPFFLCAKDLALASPRTNRHIQCRHCTKEEGVVTFNACCPKTEDELKDGVISFNPEIGSTLTCMQCTNAMRVTE